MNTLRLPLATAAALFLSPLGHAQITVTSKDVIYLNGAATPSTMVPLGTYAWTRSANFDGQYEAPPPAGQQPSIASYATTPVIDPAYAATAMRELNVPDGFEGKPWGTPPLVNHPTAVAAAPDGTIYVAMDGSGSLSAFGHLGRIVRLRDTNRDGVLDEAKPFVPDIDSPRGLLWDHDHLIVMAPPNVTAFYDRDGDGIAEEKKVLISGMGWPLTMALADHSIQNIEVGIDGWIYLAVGDIGIFKATGSDGRTLQMRSGGIVRFRSDGSGMEIFAAATRNNYGVAISPLLEVFARDNTNDGGGWNVRLHHFTGMTDSGYPSLWQNFPEEVLAPLADFGGGSGVGAMWLDEPGIPAKWNGLTTADYGQRALFHHALVPKGATYSLPGYSGGESAAKPALLTPGQEGPPAGNEPFLEASNPMDADVDANGNIYLVAWRGGGFTWTGTQFGMVYKVSPKNYTAPALPDFDRISAAALVQVLEGPSNVRRIEAQRAILRRKAELGAQVAPLLQALAADRSKPLANRAAALFTDKQLRGAQSTAQIAQLAGDPTIAALAIKALGDDLAQARSIPIPVVTAALRSPDPRTRKEALITLARADSLASAPAITALLADPDPVVSHTAVQALRSLRAVNAALAVVDSTTVPPAQRKGALLVLQSIHEDRVTNALIQRLTSDQTVERQNDLVGALARLANTEAQWNGSWWNTRPSNVGPYYAPAPWPETAKILTALNSVLNKAGPEQTLAIARQYVKQGVSAGPAVSKFLALADTEPALLPQITAYFATADEIPPNAIPVLTKAAATATNAANVRVEAITALARTPDRDNWSVILPAVASLGQGGAAAGRGGARGGAAAPAAPAIPGATIIQQLLVTDLNNAHNAALQAVVTARNALTTASLGTDANAITARAGAVAAAELALATARADTFARIQASAARFSAPQVAALAAQQAVAVPAAPAAAAAGGRGGAAAAATPAEQARSAVLNSPRLDEVYPVLIAEAAKVGGDSSQLADAALLTISARKFGAAAPRDAATRALDAGWGNPARRLQIILAAVTARDTTRAQQIIGAVNDTDVAVARAATYAIQQLTIDPAGLAAAAAGPKIGLMAPNAILDAVVPAKGTVARGAQLVRELGCVSCHTVSAGETPKGPPLNLVSKILARRELAEAILLPSKSMAQGFPTNQITRRSGGTLVGFVVQETPNAVTLQDLTMQQTRIPVADIANRTSLETSIMPQGLTGNLTITEFASLLDYLESLGR